MAGHSKWANIKHRKGKQDAKRGKVFTRLIREITVSARAGGADPGSNPRLRAAVDEAFANNMTKDTVKRAMERGAGGNEGDDYEEVRYEGYGPGGVAVLVDCMTDNRNRTVADVRHAFAKVGGNLGTEGSVGYLFKKYAILSYPAGTNEEALLEAALEAGAEDVVVAEDGSMEVLAAPDDFNKVRDALRQAKLAPEQAEVTMRAGTSVPVGQEDGQKLLKMLDLLDDLDDVQQVHANADFPDELLSAFDD
jgi:YebC/PmpR family DNA-binding regulatory protein